MWALFLAIAALTVQPAQAQHHSGGCSARRICAQPPPDAVVFVGVVVRQGESIPEESFRSPTLFRVLGVFQGLPAHQNEVALWGGPLQELEEGTRWIVEAKREAKTGKLWEAPCALTSRLTLAAPGGPGQEYLSYLNARRGGTAPTTVTSIGFATALAGAAAVSTPIRLLGPREYQFPHHRFANQPIEPGEYELVLDDPELTVVVPSDRKFRIHPGSCNSLLFLFGYGTVIAGRVLGPTGTAAPQAWVQAQLAGSELTGKTRTDERGNFEITGMQTGDYFVQASDVGSRTTFYPDVTHLQAATRIAVTRGARRDEVEIRLAKALEQTEVSLLVRGLDGMPLTSTAVSVLSQEREEDGYPNQARIDSWRTDDRGYYVGKMNMGTHITLDVYAGYTADKLDVSRGPVEFGSKEISVSQPNQSLEVRMTHRLCRPGPGDWEVCPNVED